MKNYCALFNTDCNNDCVTEFDRVIAADTLENDPYTDETRWMLKKELYRKLDDNNALLADSLLNAFYNSMQGSLIASFKNIEASRNKLFEIDSTLFLQLKYNSNIANIKMVLLQTQMELLKTAIDSGYPTTTINDSINNLQNEIKALSTWATTTLNQLRSTRIINADSIETNNGLLGTPDLIESNEKIVNDIYLSTIAKDIYKFTKAQKDALYVIAIQCPMLGGSAVFRARTMLALINNELSYNDFDICNSAGIAFLPLLVFLPPTEFNV